ncbi:fluoride efflux transporter CrcB [soil metagenome]
MTEIFLVALGGAIGAVLRYLTGLAALKLFHGSSVYTGTLFANVIGCFLAGVLLSLFSLSETTSDSVALFLTVGILGSYTTFSTFALESGKLLSGPVFKLLHYLFWQIAAAFGAVVAGYELIRFVMGAA